MIRWIGGLVAAFPIISIFNAFEVAVIGDGISVRPADILFLISLISVPLAAIRQWRRSDLIVVGSFYIAIIYLLASITARPMDSGVADTVRLAQTLIWGFLGFLFLRSDDRLDLFITALIVAASLMGIFAAAVLVYVGDVHRIGALYGYAGGEGLGRQASFNEVGAFAALATLLAVLKIFEVVTENRKLAAAYFVGSLLSLLALAATGSRSALLALMIGAAALSANPVTRFFGNRGVHAARLLSGGVFIFIAAGALTWYFSSIATVDRISSSFSKGRNAYQSIQDRLNVWSDAAEALDRQPGLMVVGGGKTWIKRNLGTPTAENFFLDAILAYGGLFATWLFVLLMTPAVALAVMHKKRSGFAFKRHAAVAATAIALTVAMTGNVVVDPMYGGVTFALLYALLASALALRPRRERAVRGAFA